MRRLTIPILLALVFTAGCARRAKTKPVGTLAELHNVKPDVQEVKVDQGLDQAMEHYRQFLKETPESTMSPEAMRRLADLEIEKQYGIHTGDAKPKDMAAPQPAQAGASAQTNSPKPTTAAAGASRRESDQDF